MKNFKKFYNSKTKEVIIVISISLIIGLLFNGPHLFDLTAPLQGDSRAHIFKIDILHNALSKGNWPDWVPYWYHGFPFDQYYPPGFSFIGALLTFITQNAVISFKLLNFFTFMINGLIIYYFSRKFLKFKLIVSIFCLITYVFSVPTLIERAGGIAPNLLGWSVTVLFLTFYLNNLSEDKIYRLKDILFPALLFGIAILIHPFPIVFAVLAIFIFHIIWFINKKPSRGIIKSQLLYLIMIFSIGIVLSATYWIPVLSTYEYSSPGYTSTINSYTFMNNTSYLSFLLIFTLLALEIGLITRLKLKNNYKLDLIIAYFILASILGFGLTQYFPFGYFLQEPRFINVVAPFFGILLLAFPLNLALSELKREKFLTLLIVVIGGAYLVFFTFILPYIMTNGDVGWNTLRGGAQNYLTPEYKDILSSVQGGRLIIPLWKGCLWCEGDSPVTFGWRYNVETVNGPYNQGDPKFFKYTVHVEWEEKWFWYNFTRENLMQESGAKYILIRNDNSPYGNMEGLKLIKNNSYGKLWELNEDVYRAASVEPILLDVNNPKQVTEFFNILLPGSYKIVFANINEINENMVRSFKYVMIDNETKISKYKNMKIFLLQDVNDNESTIIPEAWGFTFKVPYITYINKIFFHGNKIEEAQGVNWAKFNFNGISSEAINWIRELEKETTPIIGELKYEQVNYNFSENKITLNNSPGFVLIKDSYFPYWNFKQGQISPTTQGFILIYSNDRNATLNYEKPIINLIANTITLVGLVSLVIILIIKYEK